MNAQTQWTLFVGLNDGTTGEPLPDELVEQTFAKANSRIAAAFGGCTITNGVGFWGGTPENSVIVTVITSDEGAGNILRSVALFLKRKLNQQAIFLTCHPVATELI